MKFERYLTLLRQQQKIQCSQTQKRSKDNGKTVHQSVTVTSVAQIQFCKATIILLLVISIVYVLGKMHTCVVVLSKIVEDSNSGRQNVE